MWESLWHSVGTDTWQELSRYHMVHGFAVHLGDTEPLVLRINTKAPTKLSVKLSLLNDHSVQMPMQLWIGGDGVNSRSQP